MMNTLQNGDIGITSPFDNTPNRGDIVIVRSKTNKNERWIKRVIGMPGETVKCVNHTVYINNKKFTEPYLDPDLGYTEDFGPVKLKNDEYFVMGDNRVVSADSRMFGPFKSKDIISSWEYKIHTFSAFSRMINRETYTENLNNS